MSCFGKVDGDIVKSVILLIPWLLISIFVSEGKKTKRCGSLSLRDRHYALKNCSCDHAQFTTEEEEVLLVRFGLLLQIQPPENGVKRRAAFVCIAISCAAVAVCTLALSDVGKIGSVPERLKQTKAPDSAAPTSTQSRGATHVVRQTEAAAATRHSTVRRTHASLQSRTTEESLTKTDDLGSESSSSISNLHDRLSTIPVALTEEPLVRKVTEYSNVSSETTAGDILVVGKDGSNDTTETGTSSGGPEGKKATTTLSTAPSGASETPQNMTVSRSAGEASSASHASTEAAPDSSDTKMKSSGDNVTWSRASASIGITAGGTFNISSDLAPPQEPTAEAGMKSSSAPAPDVSGTHRSESDRKVTDSNVTNVLPVAGTDQPPVREESPAEDARGLVPPQTTGVREEKVSSGVSETPVNEPIKEAFGDEPEPGREGRAGGSVNNSYRLLCTVGSRATSEKMLPPDGLCDLLFYTDVIWREDAVHGSQNDRSWDVFQRAARVATRTGHGLSLDYGKSNDFFASLTMPLGRHILHELFESNIIHYGILKAKARVVELLEDMHGSLVVLRALKELQAKFIALDAGTRAGDIALGIKFLSYKNSIDSSQHSSAMTALANHLPITIFIVHTHNQDWEPGKYPLIGTIWNSWNDLVVESNEPSLRRTAQELNATTIPIRTYVMASFTLVVGEFQQQVLENNSHSASYMLIKDFTQLCSRRSGVSVVNGGLIKLRTSDYNRTYAYEDAETMSAKATAFFKLYQHPHRGWAVFDTEYEDYDNTCGNGAFSRLKAFRAQLPA